MDLRATGATGATVAATAEVPALSPFPHSGLLNLPSLVQPSLFGQTAENMQPKVDILASIPTPGL
jgi:hypothetical protein